MCFIIHHIVGGAQILMIMPNVVFIYFEGCLWNVLYRRKLEGWAGYTTMTDSIDSDGWALVC